MMDLVDPAKPWTIEIVQKSKSSPIADTPQQREMSLPKENGLPEIEEILGFVSFVFFAVGVIGGIVLIGLGANSEGQAKASLICVGIGAGLCCLIMSVVFKGFAETIKTLKAINEKLE